MKNLIYICICLLTASCVEINDLPPVDYSLGGGAFVVNEGNFNSGNGSLSFYSYDSTKLFNNVFESVNGRPLGDVPNSVFCYSSYAYILVNNSGKIEIINRNSFKSEGTITGLKSPRNMAAVTDNKAYVTSMYSDSVVIIDLLRNVVTGYINIHKSSEAIAVAGSKAYISSWIGENKIMVINTVSDEVSDSIIVGYEPESMEIDRQYRLWVLCTGGWQKLHPAELYCVDAFTNKEIRKLVFDTDASPSCLRIDGLGQTLFYLERGVRQMNIDSDVLPGAVLVPESGTFYKIGINPANSDIFVSNAGDYVHNGYVQIYKNNGTFVSKDQAGIIPGTIDFNIVFNSHENP